MTEVTNYPRKRFKIAAMCICVAAVLMLWMTAESASFHVSPVFAIFGVWFIGEIVAWCQNRNLYQRRKGWMIFGAVWGGSVGLVLGWAATFRSESTALSSALSLVTSLLLAAAFGILMASVVVFFRQAAADVGKATHTSTPRER